MKPLLKSAINHGSAVLTERGTRKSFYGEAMRPWVSLATRCWLTYSRAPG